MLRRILAVLVLIVVLTLIFSPVASAYVAFKAIEVLIGWLVANMVCKIAFKRSLTEILFDD